MGFRLGETREETDHGILHGIQREIACEYWFTSQSRSIPKFIKVMDQEGMLHTIREIQVLMLQEKNYCGIHTVEHLCRINLGGRLETVKLIFTKETCNVCLSGINIIIKETLIIILIYFPKWYMMTSGQKV